MKLRINALLSLVVVGLIGCAHEVTINPIDEAAFSGAPLVKKNVVYVLSDADRQKSVITGGGAGDSVKSFPYRDLEKTIRDVLKAIYNDVYVVKSPSDKESIAKYRASLIFAPEISVSSSSSSIITWPPTKFNIEAVLNVTDTEGTLLARPKAVGNGQAEYSEFKTTFGLSGQRAALDLAKKLETEIRGNPKLVK